MNDRVLLLFSIVAFTLFFGCVIPEQTPEKVAKANETIKGFLEEYPNAEILVTHFDKAAFANIQEEIKSDCNNKFVAAKEYYRIKISDANSGLYAIAWVDWETKQIECASKKGKKAEEAPEEKAVGETCTVGRKCKDNSHKAFQNSDCSWKSETLCEFGCFNGACKEDPCKGIGCGSRCDGNNLQYNGKCIDGNCVFETKTCAVGCINAACKQAPCTKDCNDYCENNVRHYNRACIDGNCFYSTVQCSFGCIGILCKGDPCANINCVIDKKCVNGSCVQKTCSEMQGSICASGQNCSGNTIVASDASACCIGNCQTTQPATAQCGNRVKEAGEECDGTDFGQTTCVTLGFVGGSLLCTLNCIIDSIDCSSRAATETNCSNRIDDDGDAKTDCFDPDCAGSPFCPQIYQPPYTQEYYCADGIDNDGDGEKDCVDYDCVSAGFECQSKNCADSDGGVQYLIQGTCTDDFGSRQDSCNGQNGMMRDWICSPDKRCVYRDNDCPCSAGKCSNSCVDPDGPTGYYTGTTAIDVIGAHGGDHCESSTRLREYSCNAETGTLVENYFNCPGSCEGLGGGEVKGHCIPVIGMIFITSKGWSGNFGGLGGADSKCQSAASSASLSGTWKALMSSSTTNAKDRIPDTVYKRLDGAVIANNKADLFDGSIANPINITEFGTHFTTEPGSGYGNAWTGTNSDGTSGYTCNDWTNENTSGRGNLGQGEYTDFRWTGTSSGTALCFNVEGMYCIKTSS